MTLWDLGESILFWVVVGTMAICALGAVAASIMNTED